MAYSLKLHEERVTRFLRNYPGLSREGRVRLFTILHADLRVLADFYRQNPDSRLVPDSDYFWHQVILKDKHGDARTRRFSFIVNDAPAAYGVLQVEYVEVTEVPS